MQVTNIQDGMDARGLHAPILDHEENVKQDGKMLDYRVGVSKR